MTGPVFDVGEAVALAPWNADSDRIFGRIGTFKIRDGGKV
jgi:hypothetical protein